MSVFTDLKIALQQTINLLQIKEKGYDYYITDELGGVHTDGVGYAPDGTFCGECTRESCEGCPAWNKDQSIDIYKATVFKVKFSDGDIVQVEDHENYALMITGENNHIVGNYYFTEDEPTIMHFYTINNPGGEQECTCEVVAYMFGYSEDWVEV